MIAVRLFAAAAEAVGADELSVDAASVADLRAALGATGEDAERVVGQCAMLRGGDRLDDSAELASGDVVDVLPPFAGG
ncbi:MoaD/ThiS family protein [Demequina sp. NBRC 110052]|uniref:MoaD/ThiS family protein n=1 Tax=Demequina sp. NBRC 110052 TaxID=1570341 RepID=UPI001F25C6E6|nr:MoaD/ThiS family protein [Demequina sp. NBRC 110052]